MERIRWKQWQMYILKYEKGGCRDVGLSGTGRECFRRRQNDQREHGILLCAGCDGVHVRLFYRSWFCDVAAGKPEYFGCETMCISGTQTEDDTYGADLFFYTSFLNVVILIVYCKYVLQMEFQGSMGKMLLIVAAGCVIGVSMGILVCSIGKFSEGIKVGIMLGISMTTSVLAGLVNVQIKHAVDRALPLVNKLNPAAVISDAFTVLMCMTIRYGSEMTFLHYLSCAQ